MTTADQQGIYACRHCATPIGGQHRATCPIRTRERRYMVRNHDARCYGVKPADDADTDDTQLALGV